MKAHNHHNGPARGNIYRGRCHTKKQKNQIASGLPASLKRQRKKKRKQVSTSRSNIIFTHYYQCERGIQSYEKTDRSNENNKPLKRLSIAQPAIKFGSKKAGSKASPFGGGLEGAIIVGGPAA